jgi:hypothetical protein
MASSQQLQQQQHRLQGEVIDEVDDPSAEIIIELLQQEIDELTISEHSSERQHEDRQIALETYRNELEIYKTSRWYTDRTERHPAPTVDHEFEQAPVQTFDCIICQDRFDADHALQLPCGHYYCDDDLNGLFHTAMTCEDAYPPRCCQTVVEFDDIKPFLSPKLADEYESKKEELADTKPVYCHIKTCSTYISANSKVEDTATCPACSTETCILCKQAKHGGDCMEDEGAKQTLELAKEEGWQKCPSCERMVELHTGCNHMT